jgi:hypothetical protein
MIHVRAVNDDTGDIGIVHICCESKNAAARLALDLCADGLDPADLTYAEVPADWECEGHGDEPLCAAAPITKAMVH